MDEAICAACITVAQLRPPIFGAFSGTTTMSPGLRDAPKGSPFHHPLLLFLAAMTDPSARITKTPFLSAIGVNPPAWLRYHFADRSFVAAIAVGLKTWPVTVTTL